MKQRNTIVVVALFMSVVPSGMVLPQISFQAGGGLAVITPTSDFGETTMDYYAGQAYGLSTGFGLQGKVRLGLLGFTVTGEVGLMFLSNSGNSEPGRGSVEVSQNILALRGGVEFPIKIPAVPLTPYIGANLALNRFSGETTFRGVSELPSGTFSMAAASRLGAALTGGLLLSIGPGISLDLGIAYNLMNLGGKSWDVAVPTQHQRLDSYLALNDTKDPLFQVGDDDHFIGDERSISTFQVAASVMFGL
jgi:hypothetical protein